MPRRISSEETGGIRVGNANPLTFPGQIPELLYKLSVDWVELEVYLGNLVVDFLGTDTPDTIDFINKKLFGNSLRKLLKDVADAKIVDPEANTIFENVMLAIDGQAEIRNKISHWRKQTSSVFPNAILLQEPKYIWYSKILDQRYSDHITDASVPNDQLSNFKNHAKETETNGTWVFFEEDFRFYLQNIKLFRDAFFELMWWHRGGLPQYTQKDFLRDNFTDIERFSIDFSNDPIKPLESST